MESTIDYSNYSLEELIEARGSLDTEAYPERATELDALIAKHQQSNEEQSAQVARTSDVKFYGKAGEFFSIWIVNVLLTIVTLGIYSAWAKVRTNRYFYGNTEIDGHRFAYLAEPMQILKGRIIAAILFGVVFLLQTLNPVAGLISILVMMALSPLFVILSLRFNLRMTGYRNLRFSFAGNYGRAFWLFIVLPIVSVFTFYLLMPYVLKKIDQFLVDEMSFGDKPFHSELSTGTYYGASFTAAIIAIAIFVLGFLVLGNNINDMQQQEFGLSTLGIFALYLIVYAVSSSYYQAQIRNHLFASSQIEGVAKFNSTVQTGELVMLRMTNVLAVVCTLGMAIPWVKVRNAKFFAAATQVAVLDGMDDVIAGANGTIDAIGEEAATLFDVDVSLG